MKKLILILIVGSLFAQENKYGFGFTFDGGNPIMNLLSSLTSLNTTTSLTPTLYISNNLSFAKVEPSISYYSTKSTETSYDGTTSTESNSMTIFGIGLLDNRLKNDKYSTYWGGRIAIAKYSDSDDNIYLLAPVYGAEYYFSGNFSLGGETRLNYAYDKSDERNKVIDISTHLFFRFYN